jgi:hypothetical protein
MILNGAGTYYFTVHGAKDAQLFRSVFEYEYFRKLLAQTEGCQLIAYVFSEYQAQWVMHCDQDWQVVLDNIRAQTQELHFKLWHKHQQVISESADVLFIEEDTYLVPLVMQLHHWPVSQGLAPSPEVYPWSSDKDYRQTQDQQSQSNSGLNTSKMLLRLGKQRSNTSLRYERMMEQFVPWSIKQAKNRLYHALASDAYIALYQRSKKPNLSHNKEQIISLRQQAEELICSLLGVSIEQVRHPRFRRQYYQVEPLTIWLLLQTDCSINQLVFIFDLDETIIQGWLRSLTSHHPESFLNKLKLSWQEDLHIKNTPALSQVS